MLSQYLRACDPAADGRAPDYLRTRGFRQSDPPHRRAVAAAQSHYLVSPGVRQGRRAPGPSEQAGQYARDFAADRLCDQLTHLWVGYDAVE